MGKDEINIMLRNEVIKTLIKKHGIYMVPVAISNRHVHLSQSDVEKLFGNCYKLKVVRNLSQPDQFVCEEKVTLVGAKGRMHGIRVLGPSRKETQVEISVTDSYLLGIRPTVRMSGDLQNSPGGKLIGPVGEVELSSGIIVSARHLHISDEEAKLYGFKNGDKIKIRKLGERKIVFEEVVVRSGDMHRLEVHLDTDEGNAAGIKNGEILHVEKY